MQAWLEAIVTAFVLFFIVDWTVRNANSQVKPFIPIATIIALGAEILRIIDFTSKDLREEIAKLKQEQENITNLTDALVQRSEGMKDFLEQYGNANPSIKDKGFFVEIMQKMNNYGDDAKSLSKKTYANLQAKKWLNKKSNRKVLAKAAANIFEESDLTDFGNFNSSLKQRKKILEDDIFECLNLVNISLYEMTDLRETNIQKSELVSEPNINQPYLRAIEHIKYKQLPEITRKNELSEQASKEIEKYLNYLIDKLS